MSKGKVLDPKHAAVLKELEKSLEEMSADHRQIDTFLYEGLFPMLTRFFSKQARELLVQMGKFVVPQSKHDGSLH